MVIAKIGDFGFNLFFLLHILAIVVAFAPGFVWPVIQNRLRKEGEDGIPPALAALVKANSVQIHGPALVAVGVFGLGLVALSGEAYAFSDPWISIAFVLWFVMLGVLYGLLIPAERKAAAGDARADERIAAFGGMMHILLLLMLVDMIWKPF